MANQRSRAWFMFSAGAAATLLGLAAAFSDGPTAAPAWVAPGYAVRKANPVAVDDASVAAGKTVYAKNCLACHGAQGKGDGPAAVAFATKPRDLSNPQIAEQTDGSIFWKLTNGRTPMPAFEKLTSETERWQVINYIRTLAPKPAATASQPATKP